MDKNSIEQEIIETIARLQGTLNLLEQAYYIQADRRIRSTIDKLNSALSKIQKNKNNILSDRLSQEFDKKTEK